MSWNRRGHGAKVNGRSFMLNLNHGSYSYLVLSPESPAEKKYYKINRRNWDETESPLMKKLYKIGD